MPAKQTSSICTTFVLFSAQLDIAHGNWKCDYGSSLFFPFNPLKAVLENRSNPTCSTLFTVVLHKSQGEFARNIRIYRFFFFDLLLSCMSNTTLPPNWLKVFPRRTHTKCAGFILIRLYIMIVKSVRLFNSF